MISEKDIYLVKKIILTGTDADSDVILESDFIIEKDGIKLYTDCRYFGRYRVGQEHGGE